MERFWSKVDKSIDPDGCWVWTASGTSGYGQISIDGKKVYSHRWSWEQVNGPVPEGYELDHLCRNRLCVNPHHLEAVPHDVNVKRGSVVGQKWSIGESNSRAKLNEESVNTIRQRYSLGGVTQQELAIEFGISRTQIGNIVHNRNWTK